MNQKNHLPDLLCIGFLCHDLHEGKNILGGTASYSSIMASHLGMQTALLTSVGKDFEFFAIFDQYEINICNRLAAKTTVFENIYRKGKRTQYIYDHATTLSPEDLPKEWFEIPIVKFCLIADEVNPDFLKRFPQALVGATIQGWLRQWDEEGRVRPKAMDWELLRHVDIVFLSEDDIAGFEEVIPKIADLVQIMVMTNGKEGAIVFHQGKKQHFPAFPTKEVDPTGAGDIFAAAFLVKYYQSKRILHAIAYAHAAASFIVEDYGIHLPEVSAIEQRHQQYLQQVIGRSNEK